MELRTVRTSRLPRQAPNTWNISATYDPRTNLGSTGALLQRRQHRPIQLHNSEFRWNTQSATTGIKGPNGDVYLYSHLQADAQGSFRMYRGLHLIVSGLNLTNEVFGFYQGSPIYPIQREYSKPSYIFGLG